MPAFYSVYTVIAGVNLNNLKANHNGGSPQTSDGVTVIAGVNLKNLKANHNVLTTGAEVRLAVIAGVI